MTRIARIAASALTIGTALAATDLWDLSPLRYSETASIDPIANLATELAKGKRKIEGITPLDRLRFVLKILEVPEESQMLGFSKTSKQNPLIHPGNSRCLFFNENSYVGSVPGGDIEVIAHAPLLGLVYYMISTGNGNPTLTKSTSPATSASPAISLT